MTRFWDGRTDGRTDRRTDGRTDGRSDCTPRPAFAFGDAGKNNLFIHGCALKMMASNLFNIFLFISNLEKGHGYKPTVNFTIQ